MAHATIPLSPLGVAQAATLADIQCGLFGHGIWFGVAVLEVAGLQD